MEARLAKYTDFGVRRWRNALLTVAMLAIAALWIRHEQSELRHASWLSGYLLLVCFAFLTAFRLRKRLIVLRLGSASKWMQAHIYVGLGTIVLFAWHLPWRLPTGIFESILAGLFVTTSASGIAGLWLTRRVPRMLSGLPQQVRYEHLASHRLALADEVADVIVESAQETSVLADFYTEQLATFFECPRSWNYRLFPSMDERKAWLHRVAQLDRYLKPTQRDWRRQVSEKIGLKDDLDFHQAKQSQLKTWVIGHVAMTYSLWICVAFHVYLVVTAQGSQA